MKRTIAFLCAIVFLFSLALTGCGGNTPAENSKDIEQSKDDRSQEAVSASDDSVPEVSETSSQEENAYMDADGKYVNKKQLPFKEEWKERKEFRVLVYSNKIQTTYFSEEIESLYETTDDKIREAVDTRNKEIEDELGITVKAVAVDDVAAVMRNAISSECDFDAAMPFMSAVVAFAQDGNLFDLCDFEGYLDIYAPWWDQNANNSLSIANRIFFATGDISIMQRIGSGGVAFNKKLMGDYFPGLSMYELVDNGEWTIDKFYEMCKEVTHSLTDDGVMDENDFWGTIGAGAQLYYGSGETLCSKDTDDYPIVSIGNGNSRSIEVMQKVLGYISEKDTWTVSAYDFTDKSDIWGRTVRMFGEDQSLFYNFAFSALKKFRAYDVVYGILPIPKYSKDQDGYFSRCSNIAYGACIPLNVEKPEFSAYMLDRMAVGGKNYLTKAYYDSVLKGKDANTLDDERMLDIIFGNILYDIAHVYGISALNDLFSITQPDQFSQQLQTAIPMAESKIEELIERYESQ